MTSPRAHSFVNPSCALLDEFTSMRSPLAPHVVHASLGHARLHSSFLAPFPITTTTIFTTTLLNHLVMHDSQRRFLSLALDCSARADFRRKLSAIWMRMRVVSFNPTLTNAPYFFFFDLLTLSFGCSCF
jgi:hypothetical protein